MKKMFAAFGLSVGLLLTQPYDDAHSQGKSSPRDSVHLDGGTRNIDPGGAGLSQDRPAVEAKTCTRFLPNVGLVMTVPCSDQPPEIPLLVTTTPTATRPAKATQPSARQALAREIVSHRLPRKNCSEILQRMQLNDARNDDREQLRKEC